MVVETTEPKVPAPRYFDACPIAADTLEAGILERDTSPKLHFRFILKTDRELVLKKDEEDLPKNVGIKRWIFLERN